jgi:hypothetical protein
MSTITSKPLVDRLIENNGLFEDDPPVDAIIEYTGIGGETCWKLIYHYLDAGRRIAETLLSPAVRNPKLIWSRDQSKEN